MNAYCTECGDKCEPVAESFGYAGTHCNFGQSGKHFTGNYTSDCCDADLSELPIQWRNCEDEQ